ncbi:MAG: aminopeptidase P family protein [Chloroflexi bacterium]|nr:aminopeptidase P family protein [Chloroflexota bacterium]
MARIPLRPRLPRQHLQRVQGHVTTATSAVATRLEGLRTKLAEKSVDGILISEPSNRRYLSGFVGTAGHLIISRDHAVLATDFRYTEQASRQAPDYRVERTKAGLDWLPKLAPELGIRTLAFEADNVTVSLYNRIKDAMQEARGAGVEVQLVPTSGIGLELRSVKDAPELALMQKAVDIADDAFDEISQKIIPGMTEAEIAWQIELAARARGAESLSFETIVGAGANGALPHHRAADRIVNAGEPIVIDMGARYQGYCSDLTRTIFLGKPDDEFKRVYDIVLGAQLTAIETVATGMTGAECDNLARAVIEQAGEGEAFGHSLGHGVGLDVHESPSVGATAKNVLADGMVFTIEPGIYLSGWGGVRIEDIVVLENGRARVLSKARKFVP